MPTNTTTTQSYTSLEDEKVINEVIRQCDEINWKMGRKDHESTCWWSDELDPSPVIGFKRVSHVEGADLEEMANYHAEAIIDVWAFLSKDTYSFGEHIKVFHESPELYHSLVRTMFDLPLGMAGREYLHHLYKKKVDDRTWVISYRTPDSEEEKTLPPKHEGFVRCQIFNSGDRFHLCDDGRIRVEHLMTYTLEGGVTPWMADNLFKKAHISAYFKEGKSVKEIFDNTHPDIKGSYPGQFSMYVNMQRLNPKKLLAGTKQVLDDDRVKWTSLYNEKGLQVSSGFVPYCPLKAFKSKAMLNLSLDSLTSSLSDDYVKNAPNWINDWIKGEAIRKLEDSQDRKSWLIRSFHKSHFPLKDREYTYILIQEKQEDGSVIIGLQSALCYDIPVAKNTVRGNIYPSVYRLTSVEDNQTKLEQIVIKEYNGKISRKKQNSNGFTNKIAKSAIKNTIALKALFG